MNTRPLIIYSDQLKDIAILPTHFKVESAGATTGTERGKFDGIYARISSKEFKLEDCDKPIELKGE